MGGVDVMDRRPEASGTLTGKRQSRSCGRSQGLQNPPRKRIRGKQQLLPRPVVEAKWVPALDEALDLSAGERDWLVARVSPEGQFRAKAFTGRRTRAPGVGLIPEWDPETTHLRFGPPPGSSGEEDGGWLLTLPNAIDTVDAGGGASERAQPALPFQRVHVIWGAAGAGGEASARLVAEWSPTLALWHIARRLSFPATGLRLKWQCGPRPERPQPREQEDEPEFQLRGCIGEMLAAQPPRFRRYHLRNDQLRSLHFMLDREAQPVHFTTEVNGRWAPGVRWEDQPRHHEGSNWCSEAEETAEGKELWRGVEERSGFPWCYETCLQASFPVAGGVLGDRIGSGKTATLIGLLDTQREKRILHPVPAVDEGYFIPSKATLLLVPSNLVAQWEGEISKFLGKEAFRLLVIRSVTDLRKLTVEQLADAEVVLATYKILYSPDYVERLRSLQCTRANRLHERSFYGQPIERTLEQVRMATRDVLDGGEQQVGWTVGVRLVEERVGVARPPEKLLNEEEVEDRLSRLGVCKDWRKLPHPVFELFYWQRIVFDEFHELEAMDRRRCSMLSYLRAHCRWGLTGTPPTRDMVQISELAQILRVQITDYATLECQQFVDTFVRQNAADLPEIPVEEHMVKVQQTLEERAIYLQQVHDGNRRELLQFCSHHCLQGGCHGLEGEALEAAASSAGATVAILGERKRAKQRELQEQFRAEWTVLSVLKYGVRNAQESKAEVEAAARLRSVEAELHSVEDAELQDMLARLPAVGREGASLEGLFEEAMQSVDLGRPGAAACRQALRIASGVSKLHIGSLRSAHAAQLGRCATAAGKLLTAARSLRFLQATLQAFGEVPGGEQQKRPDCPICLEAVPPEDAAVLPCAHVYHRLCILRVAASAVGVPSAACPACRAPFRHWELAGMAEASQNEPGGELVARFGSKLAAVGSTLQRIREEFPGAKAIVFVQWRELEKLVGQALDGMGIPHVRLRGPAAQRGRLIAEFQEKPEPCVLLQSLENSASGANLTRASHVLLVHPMDAESAEKAVAYETQALGRVRRCGQEAKVVHLWRFVTSGTVEEELSEEHRRGFSGTLTASGSRD